MFDFLKRKSKSTIDELPLLPFKSTEAAFEFACKMHGDEISEGSGHVGIVLDSRKLFRAQVAVKKRNDGSQVAVLKIANSDGGFIVPAEPAAKNAPELMPGDLVLWVAGEYVPELASSLGDDRAGWVGLIYAVLLPELDMKTHSFRVNLNYHDLMPR